MRSSLSKISAPGILAVPFLRRREKKRDVHAGDRFFYYLLRAFGVLVILTLAGIFFVLGRMALPAFQKFGPAFLISSDWNPVSDQFGALPFIFGTVVSSLLALAIAVPVSVGVALFLTEVAPSRIGRAIGFLVEMLAAIPSVVYSLWGVFVMVPWLRQYVQPWLGEHFGFIPLFQGAPFGVGMMAAGLVIAIMITPTISAICREVFNAVPRAQREAARALGATRWEMIRLSVLNSSHLGVLGGVTLGLGRALGETMAVTMVIGNRADISASLFAPAQTMASVLANEYSEASSDIHLSALAAIGFALFLVSVIINTLARLLVWSTMRSQGDQR